MNRTYIQHSVSVSACLLALLFIGLSAEVASAVPVQAAYSDGPACDNHGNQTLEHEIGDFTVFPFDEGIDVQAMPTSITTCVGDDGIANDWEVRMTNFSPFDYTNLFFVVDGGGFVGNTDGSIADLLFPIPGATDAFRIDGTVTAGVNNPLIAESFLADEIFQSGESWTFLVTNFFSPVAGFPAPIFDSVGAFAASSAGGLPSTASIVGDLVPEPASMGLLIIGGCAMLRRHRIA